MRAVATQAKMSRVRIAGKVIGGKVVVKETLPEGAYVVVRLDESPGDANGWELDEESWRELDEAIAEADRGETVDMNELWAQLPPLPQP